MWLYVSFNFLVENAVNLQCSPLHCVKQDIIPIAILTHFYGGAFIFGAKQWLEHCIKLVAVCQAGMNRSDSVSGVHLGHSLHPVNYVSFGMDLKTLCSGRNRCFEARTKGSVNFAFLGPTEGYLNERTLSFFSHHITACVKQRTGKRGLIQ